MVLDDQKKKFCLSRNIEWEILNSIVFHKIKYIQLYKYIIECIQID